MVATRRQKPKCLVTGGAGFLGRHVVDALTDTYDVIVFDIRESGDSKVTSIIGDIRELDQIQAACQGVIFLAHLVLQLMLIIKLCQEENLTS